MVGLVITIAQRKGGAGKTTLATQFAVTWARRGARVAALDIDPQDSFSTWVDLRRARLGAKAIGFDFAALPGWRAAQWVDDLVGAADLVIIDATLQISEFPTGDFGSNRQAVSVETDRPFRSKAAPRCEWVLVPALANRRCVIYPILLWPAKASTLVIIYSF